MRYLILFAVQATRVILVLYWFSLMRASVHAGSLHMPAPESGALLGYTLMAAGLIWLPRLRSWKHALAAFVVLTIGALRVVLAGSDFRSLGLAILTAAFFGLWHLYHQRSRDASNRSAESGTPRVTPPAPQPSVAKASVADAPSQPPTQQQPAAPAYDFNENIRYPQYTFANVVGMAETKKRLEVAAREILKGQGKPRNGMILFGDPGNGKSMFAEALAGELQVPFFSIAYGDMASKWVNETPQKVKAAFQAARKRGAGVFFIDEIDSFLKARDGNAHHMDQDLTNVLLTEIVALRGSQVILVAATNMLDQLDGAGIREGRFDYKIEIPAPDLQARQAILRRSIGDELGFDLVDSEAVKKLAERWEGFSASRLSSLGPQLYEMWRDGQFASKVTFDVGMRAMRLLQGRRGKLPENVKSIDEILMPEASRNALRDLAFKMENVDNLERIGGRLPPGVIFIGPP